MACGSTHSSRHRGADPATSSGTVPQTRTVIEYRKDGAVSKMRSHKGNIPVLPQTKLCPQCPAKFTRTTHLNRHLRTHTGDRSHRCDTCDAQFTRSDLLTRHKKTCGESSHANRTRRRSCQACADSKVKCDLQRPCSKCLARGKECMFVIRSRSTSGGIAPQLSTTTVEQSTDAEDRAPTLIPTTVQSAASPSPKPYPPSDHHLPIDQQIKGDCHWAAAPPAAASDGIVHEPDGVSPSSPLERYCSDSPSDVGSAVPSSSVPPQNPFATLYTGDLLEPFFSSVFTGYNNSSPHLSCDSSLAPSDPVVASPSSSVDDPISYTTQSTEVNHHSFHASGESGYYATPSDQQVHDAIPKDHMHLHRQRYSQGHLMPPFSGPVHNLKQHEFSEEQHYHTVDSSAAPNRTRVRMAGPYQVFGSARRALRESYSGQMHFAYVDPVEGDFYGRNCEKRASQTRISGGFPPNQHWHVSQENESFDSQPRYDDQRYRPAFAECFVDSLQWNGAHAMRRQVIDPA